MQNREAAFAAQEKGGRMIKQTLFWYLGMRGLANFAMSLHFAIYTTFLLSRGLNLLEANLVNAVFYVTLFVFEIPTGAFADVFGRKTSVVLSGVFNTFGTLVYFLATGFWGFAAAEGLLAIGSTFVSGAFTAWAIDRMKHFGYRGISKNLFVKEQQVMLGVAIVGGLLGSFIATKNLSLTWLVSSVLFLLWTVLAFWGLREEYFQRQSFSFREGLEALKRTTRSSIEFGIRHKTVRFILLIGALQYLCLMPGNMQWQPWFGQFFHSVSFNGWLWVGMSMVVVVGSTMAKAVLARHIGEAKALLYTQVLLGVSLAGTVVFRALPLSLFVFMLHEFGRGLFKPIKDAYLNDQLPSSERATVVSFEAIAHHLGGGIGLLVSGWTAAVLGIPVTWMLFGLALALGSVVIYRCSQS